MTASPRQIKAARALLGWTMEDLAEASGVARSTVADYERSGRTVKTSTATTMVEAMESVGVVFLSDGVRVDACKRVAAGVRAIAAKRLG
jgi:transcriptional regulator with XRE-family HTH domain